MPLTREQIRADIADILDEDPADIPDDADLIDLGLDSIRLMTLLERWRPRLPAAPTPTFTDLIESPSLARWTALLAR